MKLLDLIMCDCINVQFGTYGQQDQNRTVVCTPQGRRQEIDNCILSELKDLWNKGIITLASCCGHNKINGSIIVEDCDKMKSLGYINWPDHEDWFYPQSIPITNKWI